MRLILFAACGLALVAVLLVPGVAAAQYVTPPGGGPHIGGTDNGERSRDAGSLQNDAVSDPANPPGDGPSVEVQAKQFARDISSSSHGFQLFWLWLLLALALGLLFLFLWRRRRDEAEDDFSGAQPV
jgi:hypothetical protein